MRYEITYHQKRLGQRHHTNTDTLLPDGACSLPQARRRNLIEERSTRRRRSPLPPKYFAPHLPQKGKRQISTTFGKPARAWFSTRGWRERGDSASRSVMLRGPTIARKGDVFSSARLVHEGQTGNFAHHKHQQHQQRNISRPFEKTPIRKTSVRPPRGRHHIHRLFARL